MPLTPQQIDELYGLDPVLEPGLAPSGDPTPFVTVACPYCGEAFDTQVDVSAGSSRYVEDCQVCCQPIEIACDVDGDGALSSVTANRQG